MKEVIRPGWMFQFAPSQGWFIHAQTETYCTGTPHRGRWDNDNYLVAFCQLVMSTSVFFVLQ